MLYISLPIYLSSYRTGNKCVSDMNDNDDILRRIEWVILDVIRDIKQCKPPKLCFPRRCNWDELAFDETVKLNPLVNCRAYSTVDTGQPKSLKKFAAMLKVLKTIYTLIQENRFCTKRDIFYQYPDLYSSQSSMDRVIDDVACMLKVPRWDLHILATSKGLVAGDLQFTDQTGLVIDCQSTPIGIQVPAHMKDVQNIKTTARFVLVVEKDATFQKLLGYLFCQKMDPCIIITGKGFPDNGTRLLLRQLRQQYNLPIFILVDADPHGIEIMAVYKYGSMNQAFENQHLAVPQAEWIGIWPEDISRLNIKGSSLAPLTKGDFQKAQALKKRPYIKNDDYFLSQRMKPLSSVAPSSMSSIAEHSAGENFGSGRKGKQIEFFIESGYKAEIQSLDSISPNYLCDIYLPSKINLMCSSIQ